jgi:hypothetical protein
VIPKQATGRSGAQAPATKTPHKAKRLRSPGNNLWRLPWGARLDEFALASGFLTPPLMENDRGNRHGRKNDL